MSYTEQQSAAISARGKVIVSASAGSGKTTVMIDRLADLVESGESVDRVLAVTFTNKAAAQMRERMRKKLLERAKCADGVKKAHIHAQLDALPLADICTVHAFCGRLVRTYFYLVGQDPKFRIAGEDGEGASIKKRAEDATFERVYEENPPWFARLLKIYYRRKKDDMLRGVVRSLYAAVRNAANYRTRLEEDIAKSPEEGFSDMLACLMESYRSQARKIAASSRELIPMSEADAPKGVPALIATAEFADAVAAQEDFYALQKLVTTFTFPAVPKRSKNDPALTRCVDRMRLLARRRDALIANILSEKADRAQALSDYANAKETADGLLRLVLLFDESYTVEKRESGVLDYDDLEHLALAVLSDDEVRAAVRDRYKFVFVDEYQDINPLQNAILEAVSGEEIFLVGDKKQAIYGFRGSRAKFFTEQEHALGGALSLDRNFRSAPVVLDAVNTVFSTVLEGYVPMTGGDRFPTDGELYLHTAPKDAKETVERGVYSVLQATGDEEQSAIARKVVEIVEAERGRPLFDPDLGEVRRTEYGDIAILVRKQTATARAILGRLAERGIPVTATAESNVLDFFEGKLLYNWLSFLDNGEQDIPLAGCMLSAAGGFTDGELGQIRLAAPPRTTFREACTCYLARHDGLAEKLRTFLSYTQRMRTLSQVKTAQEILFLLLSDGLEAQIAASGGEEALARAARFTEEGAGMSVHAFLKKIADGGDKIVFAESGGEGAVKLTTMHSSKGLEYPVVILTDIDTSFRMPDEKDETLWTDELGAAPKYFDFKTRTTRGTLARLAAKNLLSNDEREGEYNLLYVAMTRAKCRLHLVYEREKTNEKTESFAWLAPRFLLEPLAGTWTQEEAPPEEKEEKAFSLADIERAVFSYPFPKATEIPVKDSATGLIRRMHEKEGSTSDMGAPFSVEEDFFAPVLGDAPHSREEGLAYHAFLEHVRFGADAREELARMKGEGLLSAEQIALLDEERLCRILGIPTLKALEGKQTWREQRFLVSLPAELFYEAEEGDTEVLFQGALDLLVLDEKGYHIIDYKDSARSDDAICAGYAPQMRLYRKAVAKICRVAEENVRVTIVNIAAAREIIFA